MFGTTRELHQLLLASDALEHDATANPSMQPSDIGSNGKELSGSARRYYQLLSEKWKQDCVRTRVVVDIISGTSAGGINGIILAKAIATNGRMEPLRRLWFEEADFERLAGGGPWTLRAGWRLLHNQPALTGDGWLRQLYQAFAAMEGEKSSQSQSLLPPHSRLDLLVTSTDFYGSPRVVEVGDPATSHDKYHNQVFRFVEDLDRPSDIPDFSGANANATLAFAARSSASFPVAFPPTSIDGLIKALKAQSEVKLNAEEVARRVFGNQLRDRGKCPPYKDCAQVLAEELFLVDGGVLDNYPLGIAFQRANHTRPASVPAERIFLYLEPDPAEPPPEGRTDKGAPNALQMLLGGKAGIPGNEPIAEDFQQLVQHNQRVDRLLDLLSRNEKQARLEAPLKIRKDANPKQEEIAAAPPEQATSVAAQVESVVNYDLGSGMPTDLRPRLFWSQQAPLSQEAVGFERLLIELDAASEQAPLVEEAYIRLRMHSILDQLARDFGTAICGLSEEYEGPRASLARAIVFQWAEANCLKEAAPRPGSAAGTSTPVCPKGLNQELRRDFLSGWDIGYLRRNLRFVLAWIDAQAWIQGRTWINPGGEPQGSYGLTSEQLQRAHEAVANKIKDATALVHAENLPLLFAEDPMALATFRELHDSLESALCVEPDRNKLVGDQAAALLDVNKYLIDDFVNLLGPKLVIEQNRIRAELFKEFVAQTQNWKDDDARRAVLARYLGFPYWDRVAYPYTAFSGTGELVRASVVRLSPRDAQSLSKVGAARLSGSQLGHFGAFRHRGGREKREHDYLWGRFDGAERLSKLLGSSDPSGFFSDILDNEAKAQPPINSQVLSSLWNCIKNPGSQSCNQP
jgi:predicted acylesterase/phospholipase RssA